MKPKTETLGKRVCGEPLEYSRGSEGWKFDYYFFCEVGRCGFRIDFPKSFSRVDAIRIANATVRAMKRAKKARAR